MAMLMHRHCGPAVDHHHRAIPAASAPIHRLVWQDGEERP